MSPRASFAGETKAKTLDVVCRAGETRSDHRADLSLLLHDARRIQRSLVLRSGVGYSFP